MTAARGAELVERVSGAGWLKHGDTALSLATYVVELWRVRTGDSGRLQCWVELSGHDVAPRRWQGVPLTLHLEDRRTVTGLLSEDGSALVLTDEVWPAEGADIF